MLALFSLVACGQYVPAEDANVSPGGATDCLPTSELPSRDELSQAMVLGHYAQLGLLQVHTGETTINGVSMRGVDYAALEGSIEAQLTLGDVLANLSSVDPMMLQSRADKLAYWLNVYNAWMIEGVLASLAEDPSFDSVGANDFALFSTPFISLGDHTFTLDQVEHAIIRGDDYAFDNYFVDRPTDLQMARDWHEDLFGDDPVDARIHVGLNCASVGCPDILDGAFRGEVLDQQLDAAATRFVDNDAKGAGPNGLSQLFSWFSADFNGSFGSVEAFVAKYRTGGDGDVDYDTTIEYDWALNRL